MGKVRSYMDWSGCIVLLYMLTSDLTSLASPQFSHWLQVRKVGTIYLNIYFEFVIRSIIPGVFALPTPFCWFIYSYAVDLVVCCALGVDMFDCVYPTRTAVGSLWKMLHINSWTNISGKLRTLSLLMRRSIRNFNIPFPSIFFLPLNVVIGQCRAV